MKKKFFNKITETTGIAFAILFLLFVFSPLYVQADSQDLEGDYYIPVSLWHAIDDKASLGNDAVGQMAKLSVTGNSGTLSLKFTAMSFAGMEGYLMRMDVLDEIKFNENGYPEKYSLVAGEICSAYDVTDEYNSPQSSDLQCAGRQYPRMIRIPAALGEKYTYVEVYVPVMGSMGFGEQICRVKLDFNNVVPMSAKESQEWEEDGNFEPAPNPDNDGEEQTEPETSGSSDTEEIDINNLADGKYKVQADFWHAAADKESMGNPALNKPSLLTVENGVYQIEISTRPMTVGTITTCLDSVQIKQFDGSYLFADITARNNEGGKPSVFQFVLPSNDVYTDIKIDPQVEMMGNEPLAARLKISWETIEKTEKDAEVEENNEVADSGFSTEAVDLTDEKTGVRIQAAANILVTGVTMSCKKLTSGNVYKNAKTLLTDIGSNMVIYQITLKSPDGTAVQPSGMVKLSIPIPDKITGNNIQAYRIAKNSKVLLSGTKADGYYVVNTNKVQTSALVQMEETAKIPGKTPVSQRNSVVPAAKSGDTTSVKSSGAVNSTAKAETNTETKIEEQKQTKLIPSQLLRSSKAGSGTPKKIAYGISVISMIMSMIYVVIISSAVLKGRAGKIKRISGVIFVSLILSAASLGMVSYAAEKGTTYIAGVARSYGHPVTGEVADPGDNAEIGQPMVESVGHPQALIEKTENGSVYATVRIFMTDSISEVRFYTQTAGSGGFSGASASVMQENVNGDYCSDYRFKIPSEDVVIKVAAFVEPMGREVWFFMSFTDFQEGNTDFIVSVDTMKEEAAEPSAEDPAADVTVTETVNGSETENTEAVSIGMTAGKTEKTKVSARDLIAQADGLTVSDTEVESEDVPEGETKTGIQEAASEWIQPLPWVFVWQCILLMTVPALVIGAILITVRLIFNKRGQS